ncbi:MAG: hypothetical protein ACKV2V_12395 [Blastocatellia bacterium]
MKSNVSPRPAPPRVIRRKPVMLFLLAIMAFPAFPAGPAGVNIALAQTSASTASSVRPTEPLTLSQMHLLLRRSVGRDMTEGDLATLVERNGIAFDPNPEAISRLRANGAHQHLINAVRRANDKLAAAAGEVISIRPGAPDPVIEETRQNVMAYSDELPDFVCNQEITRFADIDGTGAWDKYDTLTYEVAYHLKNESYKPLNALGRPVTLPLDQAGGATSSGDFGIRLAHLFSPETKANFKSAGKDRLGTRNALLYDFRVPLATSRWQISAENHKPIVAGYSGTVWIDAETKKVLRIELAADNLPRDYPVTQAEGSTDYDMVKLRGLEIDYLLPIRSEITIGDRKQRRSYRNISYYKFYRKFETGVKITDGDDEPPPAKENKKPEKP